jgi:hypothetical protein
LRKKVEKRATVKIFPPNASGDSIVRIHAEEHQEIDIDLCMEHRAAMELLFSLLMDHQVADIRRRTFKH